MKLINLIIAAGVISLTGLLGASAQASDSAQEFVTKASVANEFEIKSSQAALNRSRNPEVKKFAQRMVDDHSKTADNLEATLRSSASGAEAEEGLDKKHQKMLDKLNAKSGDKFDKCYIDMQTKAHKKAVSLFKDYAKKGKDAALKNFAAQTLPTLESHLEHVKQLKVRE